MSFSSLTKRLRAHLRSSHFGRSLRTRFPRTTTFLAQRLKRSDLLGLNLTLFCVAAGLCWFIFFGLVQDLLATDPLIRSDLRIITLLQTFRSPRLTVAMVFFTYLGNWQIVTGTAVLFGLLLYMRRQWWWLLSFFLALITGEAVVQLVKHVFARTRPDLHNAVLPAAGASFPSGHSFAATVVYGIFTAYLIARVNGIWKKAGVALLGAMTIVLVGFSRIYLGVHWPSDVLAGITLGAAWTISVMATVTVLMIRHGYSFREASREPRFFAQVLGLLWLTGVGAFYFSHPVPTPSMGTELPIRVPFADPETVFKFLPRFTEDIVGNKIEPINILIVGPNKDLLPTLADARWRPADPLTLASAITLVMVELGNKPDPAGPGLPVFLAGQPNDLTFERPLASGTARKRYHLHLWTTRLRVGQSVVWVGTVHLDTTGTVTPFRTAVSPG